VPGSLPAPTGEALVRHPKVDLIAFTGSVAAGRRIAAQAGQELKKVNLELGSVDPFIVFADADLDVAVPGVAWARLLNAGQVCISPKRVYLVEPIAGEFTRRLEEYVRGLTVGNPMDPAVEVGPLISAGALETVERQVAQAVAQGATLRLGGARVQPGDLPGHFPRPGDPHRCSPRVRGPQRR
jgi:acyl-CoA reductase-like NAD-dependent aldehyde dehydrogenase